MTERRTKLLRAGALLAIVIATAAAYAPSLHGVFQFDDYSSVQTNWALRDLGSLLRNLSPVDFLGPGRPLADLSFGLDFALGGLDPFPYRLTSLAVHLAAVLVAFFFARGALRRAGHPRAEPIAFFVAAVFALHPLQTESVCYVCQRSEAMSSALYLASLLLLARAFDAWPRRSALGWAAGGTLVALIATGAKTIAVTLPAAFLLYAVLLGRAAKLAAGTPPGAAPHTAAGEGRAARRAAERERRREGSGRVARPGPQAGGAVARRAGRALAVGAGAWAIAIGAAVRNLMSLGPGQTAGFYAGEIGPWRYFLTQLRVHWWYAKLLAWPRGQTVGPALSPSPASPDLATVAAGLATLALLVGAGLLWWREERREAPSPGIRVAAFGVFWWYLLLAPTSSVVPVADITFEHRAYLAALGPLLALAVGLEALVVRLEARSEGRRVGAIAAGAAVALCVALGVATALRAQVWTSEISLWGDEAAKHPTEHRIVDNYAYALSNAGRPDEAIQVFLRAQGLARTPRDFANTARNFGSLYLDLGRLQAALDVTDWGLARAPYDWEVLVVRANTLFRMGRYEEALQPARAATRFAPGAPNAHDAAGLALIGLHRTGEALEEFRTAQRIDPGERVYADHVFHALVELGRHQEACATWEGAQALQGRADPGMNRLAARLGCRR